MEKDEVGLYAHPDFPGNADLFYGKYELVDLIFASTDRYWKRNLKGYSTRTCRFCLRSYRDAAFSNLSHLLPKLLGNSNLYSDFECDDCNKYFSGFENDLAEYLAFDTQC